MKIFSKFLALSYLRGNVSSFNTNTNILVYICYPSIFIFVFIFFILRVIVSFGKTVAACGIHTLSLMENPTVSSLDEYMQC